MRFDELDIPYELMDGIKAMGFDQTTPIQEAAIPPILEGKDLIGIAQTGTGKTAAFLIPLMSILMDMGERKGVGALIVVPTRELAVQIDQAAQGLSYFTGMSSMAIYGGGDGMDFRQEKAALTGGTDIIIATPGRILSHINLGYVPLSTLPVLVLDEADRMLDMGFYNDIMRIIRATNPKRQTLMFSATMPDKIRQLTSQILNNPITVSIALSKPAEGVEQIAYSVFEEQKNPLLVEILKSEDWKSVIVFSGTKRIVSQIDAFLQKKGINSRAISSDLEQDEREEVLLGFRNRKIPILVATNVVSRGIDIDDIEMVINFDVPRDAEEYVHRIGRTARASRKGRAVTLVSPSEQMQFQRIEQLIGQVVLKPEVPSSLGPTPEYAPSGKRRREGEGGNQKGKGGFKKSGGQNKRRFNSKDGKPKSNPNGGRVGE